MSGRLRRILRGIVIGGSLAALVVLPAAVAADTTNPPSIVGPSSNGATITVGTKVTVSSRLVATVHIEFTCDPFEVFDWETGQTTTSTAGHLEGGSVVLLQAQGRQIAYGTGGAGFGGAAITCDGSTVNARDVSVTAAISPWRSGTAVAGADVYVIDDGASSADYASSGPVVVSLARK